MAEEYIYLFEGDAYKYEEKPEDLLGNFSLKTTAVSIAKAKSNFKFQIRHREGLPETTPILIAEEDIQDMGKPRELPIPPQYICPMCLGDKYENDYCPDCAYRPDHIKEAHIAQLDTHIPDKPDPKGNNGICPCCGTASYDGTICTVCGYKEYPEGLGDIDTEHVKDKESEKDLNRQADFNTWEETSPDTWEFHVEETDYFAIVWRLEGGYTWSLCDPEGNEIDFWGESNSLVEAQEMAESGLSDLLHEYLASQNKKAVNLGDWKKLFENKSEAVHLYRDPFSDKCSIIHKELIPYQSTYGYVWLIYDGYDSRLSDRYMWYDVPEVLAGEASSFVGAARAAADAMETLDTTYASLNKVSGGMIEYDDDLVIVYDPEGDEVYRGLADYCPYMEGIDNGWLIYKYDSQMYEGVDGTPGEGYVIEKIGTIVIN